MKKTCLILCTTVVSWTGMNAQTEVEPGQENKEWHHGSIGEESVYGVRTDEALEFLKGRKSEEVIVAIMDSGIDTTHSDLRSQLWVNEDEIPGNGIDDDGNGYVDDVHGWNFIGGPNGNVEEETMELTRLYSKYKEKYANLSKEQADSIKEKYPAEWDRYQSILKDYIQQNVAQRQEKKALEGIMAMFETHRQAVVEVLGEDYSFKQLDSLSRSDSRAAKNASTILNFEAQGFSVEDLMEYEEQVNTYVNYYLNPDWNVREDIVGDDPDDFNDSLYGNNDIMGSSSGHGTHVAGIVGAARDNNIGTDGIAPNVKIMVIRVVPDGDERDKDVAMGIRYAVNNGASIINMSFGKDYSPDADKVQETARWAADHDVLIIHAAGNDGRDLDRGENYPFMPFEENNLENEAWIEVGASTFDSAHLAADFSNYGDQSVDLFAPGDEIYSTLPPDRYGFRSGTSMAAPVVTGIAAMVRSYFPSLTAQQVKDVLIRSVQVPHSTDLREISITGGVADARRAVELASEMAQ